MVVIFLGFTAIHDHNLINFFFDYKEMKAGEILLSSIILLSSSRIVFYILENYYKLVMLTHNKIKFSESDKTNFWNKIKAIIIVCMNRKPYLYIKKYTDDKLGNNLSSSDYFVNWEKYLYSVIGYFNLLLISLTTYGTIESVTILIWLPSSLWLLLLIIEPTLFILVYKIYSKIYFSREKRPTSTKWESIGAQKEAEYLNNLRIIKEYKDSIDESKSGKKSDV